MIFKHSVKYMSLQFLPEKISCYVNTWQLILANPGQVVLDKLHASNFANLIGQDKIFLTVADAVLTCSPKRAEEV